MENKEKSEAQKVRCLMLNESKDVLKFGSDDTNSKLQTLTFFLNDNAIKKCADFQYEKDFILHLYITDSFDDELIVGVNRFEKCSIKEFDSVKKIVRIKACNKEFFNMSQLKLLRKDKIGNILLEMGDNESPAIEN